MTELGVDVRVPRCASAGPSGGVLPTIRRRVSECVAIACLTTAVLAATCSSASAFTFELATGHATVIAATGEVNAFDVQDLSGGVVISDAAQNPVSTPIPAGCVSDLAWEVVCQPGVISDVSVDGGDGNDTVSNASVLARVSLAGGAGNDQLSGRPASETLFGGPGNDSIQGGAGVDTIAGGDGNDHLVGADGDDSLSGGEGDDRLDGSDGNDISDGGAGADTLTGGDGNDALTGGAGNDQLSGDDGADTVLSGEGDDLLDGGRGADRLEGGEGADELIGGEGADSLRGDGGSDRLSGGAGSDELSGQAGADMLAGGDGDDHLDGGLDADSLIGAGGNDVLDGADGDDVLIGGEGSDRMSGGTGGDVVSYSAESGALRVTIDDLADDGIGGERDDVRSDVEQVIGGSGPDVLVGSPRADRLDGGGGDDLLDGGGGPDRLVGGDGSDTVTYASRIGRVLSQIGGDGGEAGEGDVIDASVESLTGGSGPDQLTGMAGAINVLSGGGGDDLLIAREGSSEADRTVCGDGKDRVTMDRPDFAAADCERVRADGRLTRPVPPPRVFVGSRRLRMDASRRVALGAQCSAAADRVCGGAVRLTARRDGMGPTLGSGRFRIAPRASARVSLLLTPRLVREVRRSGRRGVGVWAQVRVRDAAGRRSSRAVRVTVRSGKSS